MTELVDRQFMLSAILARDPDATRLHLRHLQVLEHVCSGNGVLTSAVIAAELDISPAQTSRLLAKLESHEMITRSDPRYRPMTWGPTVRGRALIIRLRTYVSACLSTDQAA
jgi:DNA-binding MarR family transcriptional regulator